MSRATAIATLAERLAALDLDNARAHQMRTEAHISELESALGNALSRIKEIDRRKVEIRDRTADASRAASEFLSRGTVSNHDELEELKAERDGLLLAARGLRPRIDDAYVRQRRPGGPLRDELRAITRDFAVAIEPEVVRICEDLASIFGVISAANQAMPDGGLDRTFSALRDAMGHLAEAKLVGRTTAVPGDMLAALEVGSEALAICGLHISTTESVPMPRVATNEMIHALRSR